VDAANLAAAEKPWCHAFSTGVEVFAAMDSAALAASEKLAKMVATEGMALELVAAYPSGYLTSTMIVSPVGFAGLGRIIDGPR
jgi:hypothetical protein